MATTENLDIIKTLAKRLARARRTKHIDALELVARELGFPHWNALMSDFKKGWRPSSADLEAAENLLGAVNPLRSKDIGGAALSPFSQVVGLTITSSTSQTDYDPFSADEITGELDGHQFRLLVLLDDVIMEGRGWRILIPEAPTAKPEVQLTDRRLKLNPISDENFLAKAMAAANMRAAQVHARIASDWPRRSTIPDAKGNAQHPLFGSVSSEWFCLHCDGEFSGTQLAKNFWHCPACSATPIEIHESRWWCDQPS